MKPAAVGISNTGSIVGESNAMGIDYDSIEHIMGVLTNLYRNPKQAILREYSVNALDAHIDAGNTAPVEISLPSAYDPQLEIRDFGTGLSTDELLRVYSQYGASTKRGTNEQTGMLGLGSKSALAYAKQFTVISRRNGILTQALIFLNDRGAGEITIVDTRGTDEPNGTTIRIPIATEDVTSFIAEAETVFSVWTPGTILVNGKRPKHITEPERDDAQVLVADNVVMRTSVDRWGYRNHGREAYIIQGSVAYPVRDSEFSISEFLPNGTTAYISVPIGTIQMVPSREDIYYTDITKKALATVFANMTKTVGDAISKNIQNEKTLYAAWVAADDYAVFTNQRTEYIWKNQTIPSVLPFDGSIGSTQKRTSLNGTPSFSVQLITGNNRYYASTPIKAIITGYSAEFTSSGNISTAHRERIRGFLGVSDSIASDRYGRKEGNYTFAITRSETLDPATARVLASSDIKVLSWAELMKATKVATVRTGGGNGQAHLEYMARKWNVLGEMADAKVISDSQAKIAFVRRGDEGSYGWAKLDFSLLPVDHIVVIGTNQVDRFRREYPNSIPMAELVQWVHAERDRRIKAGQAKDYSASSWFSNNTWAAKADDPMLTGMKRDTSEWERFADVLRFMNVMVTRDNRDIDAVNKAYPLLATGRGKPAELLEYVNALFAYRKGN